MRNTEIWQYLGALNARERREFRLWLLSPAFNRRSEVLRLFDFLDMNLAKRTNRDITKAEAWKKAFPDQPFDAKQLHYTGHYLLRLIQRFIAVTEMESDAGRMQYYLCKGLKKRQLDSFFEREMRTLEALQDTYPFVGEADFHYSKYQFYTEKHAYRSRRSRTAELPLRELFDSLGDFYLASLLRYACSAVTRATVANQHARIKLLPEVLQYLGENQPDPAAAPAVAAYYRCYRLLDGSGDDADFYALTGFMEEQWRKFPLSESRDIWLLAINYGIRRINSGEQKFIRETFELYRAGLDKNILPGEGFLTDFSYKNIARLGLGLGEYAWTEQFLHEVQQYLDPQTRHNIVQYSMAMFHFYQKNYDEAMQILTGVELGDVFLNLDARSMLLRIYFEKGFFDALESLLDSFQTFIRRQKNLGYHSENYLNLIRFTRQLLRLSTLDEEGRKRLRTEIQSTAALAEKGWLLEKL